MDKNSLIILKSDLNAQLKLIKTIDQRLIDRAKGLVSDDIIRLESIAYQIHNLYNATEDLLKIVASYFENNITDTSQWHSALLQRMCQDIPEIRPALLSPETFLILNSLRGFRHFFRHAYGTSIEYEQLKINLDKALNLLPNLEKDLENFIEQLL
jgi:uncharacterized protein YutE (UPF0331/DUF86 family)